MVLDISNSTFRRIFDDTQLFLPIQWDGVNFAGTLERLYNAYIINVERSIGIDDSRRGNSGTTHMVKQICGLIRNSVGSYLDGFPSKAYAELEKAMDILVQTPLKIYQKSIFEQLDDTEDYAFNDNLALYRMVCVDDYFPYGRTRVFHTPYTLRSKVSTSRYSIAGYPSLYLGTSLQLCAEEINYNPHRSFAIASRYKIERCIEFNNTEVDVIELAVKPQDFLDLERNRESNRIVRRMIQEDLLNSSSVRNAYLLWYPLIAACSYIRTNKKDPFAAEYIVPQLLMQWVRNEIQYSDNPDYDKLIGIRYFSCASKRASDMGFNYVFPASGKQHSGQYPYCPVLMNAFRLTAPKYIHESGSVEECGNDLLLEEDFEPING
jgi:hypothetical protein